MNEIDRLTVIVTGGAGYIGSHMAVQLLADGYHVVVLDNLSTGSKCAVSRIQEAARAEIEFVKADVRDARALSRIFSRYKVFAVMHFAGLKSVADSIVSPLEYYDINVGGTATLCRAMSEAGVYRLVFSSSATVYGTEAPVPYTEDSEVGIPSSPYGQTKLAVERMLYDLAQSNEAWRIAILRYFNPAGAHPSGVIGESPVGLPNNLIPYVAQVAAGTIPFVRIFGDDYSTRDGTAVRDYVHIMDLVEGHLAALKKLDWSAGARIWNLGTGVGHSVRDVINAFERVIGRAIPYVIAPRRIGDLPAYWADVTRAQNELGWRAAAGLNEIIEHAWQWQVRNPDGYG